MIVIIFILVYSNFLVAQYDYRKNINGINTTDFIDSAHHWYDINDEEKIIKPVQGQKRYETSQINEIADNILLFQKLNGGWPKNYDMRAILTEDQKASLQKAKNIFNTTFDNGATHSQINYLAKVYSLTKIEKYKNAFINGIKFIIEAQYENGGWPQYYPDKKGYRKYITFNDGAMIGIMNVLKRIVDHPEEFHFIEGTLYKKINSSYSKGIECILNCQIIENGELTVWCQQHDDKDFHPQNARSFELASITNGESSEIVKFLMTIENPDEKIISSINSAVKWFEESKIYGIRVELIKAPKADYMYHSTDEDKVVVNDSTAQPIWARYYELGTHKPMFCNRDGKVVYSLKEVERERRTGYAWYVYDPQVILDLYPAWRDKWIIK